MVGQAREAQRKTNGEHLVAMIAHELANALQLIQSRTVVARTRLAQAPDDARHDLERALQAIHRATHLTQELKVLGQNRPLSREPVQLATLVSEIAEFAAGFDRVRVDVRIEREVPMVLGDPMRLHQVLLNLVLNAKDAMPGGGTLTLAVARTRAGVEVRVQDSGVGIPQSLQAKIFEPFFTTHADHGGTGLGLAVTRDIVTEHAARMQVESGSGTGTTFRLTFPIPKGLRQLRRKAL